MTAHKNQPMGFLAQFQRKQRKEHPETFKMLKRDPAQKFIGFDSGRGLSFMDGKHHTLVFGTTGSGKSLSIILPAINNVMAARHSMLVGDIKGTLGDKVYKLAELCGRGEDVVEYGNGQRAKKLNILAGMGDDSIRLYFEQMVYNICPSGDGKSWALKGAHMAADCAILLRLMHQENPDFLPSLGMVSEMINNPFEAAILYTIFLDKYFDSGNDAQRHFVSRINNNEFHILAKLDKIGGSYSMGKKDKTYDEQITWNLQAVRMGLRSFLEAPGIAEHFSSPGAPGVDLASDIMQGKIILLRFGALAGPTGTLLARQLLSEAYRIILKTPLQERNNRLFFVVLDEFQEYADFSENAGSDKNFVAQAREFGGCFLGATQSQSSLVCKVENSLAVEAFVGNCNSILSFYSHDPSTQALALRYNAHVRLNRLQPGKIFAVTYDTESRKHVQTMESVNNAYREITATLDKISLLPPVPEVEVQGAPAVSFVGMVENLNNKIKSEREARKAEWKWQHRNE